MMSKFERREIDKLYMYKKESPTKLCDIYLILLFIPTVKKNLNDGHCVQDRYMSACTACEHILGSQTAFNNNWENHA